MKQIKEVCVMSGLSKRTLQFYDERFLLNVGRTKENYRVYNDGDLDKLWLILIYKEMGFSLSEICELLNSTEDEIRSIMANKLIEIEVEISELERRYRFIDKVMRYGIPERNSSYVLDGDMTMAEYAKILSERI